MTDHVDAFVAATDTHVVEVTGADRASYLQAVLSQDVVGLAAGAVTGTLHLDQHGRALALFDVVALEDRMLLLVPDADLAVEVATSLGSRTFLADASFEVVDLEVRALRGKRAGELAADAGLGAEPRRAREDGDLLVVGRDDGVDLVGGADALRPAVGRLHDAGVADGSADDLEAWRIANGVPAWGHEVRPPHLPEELGLLPTHVHLEKGCYPGQEAVARMWMLGRPRRRLARVLLTGDAVQGWSTGSGKQGVEVTSAAEVDGERVGLAFVPSDASVGDRFGDEEGSVLVRGLVGEGQPVPGHDPAVTRRRDKRRR